MQSTSSGLFPGLFKDQPDLVRNFLYTALQLRDLQSLYAEARTSSQDTFSESILRLLKISLNVTPDDLDRVPAKGAVVIVANHPSGLLDGILLDSLLRRIRPDIRILTNKLLSTIPELKDRCLPIEMDGHSQDNIRTLRKVVQLLNAGQGAAFFPAGEVSHWQMDSHCVTDPVWNTAAVRCARRTSACIVPFFFSVSNGLGFQLAGLIHPRLRTARLPCELMNKKGRAVELRVGTPIKSSELDRFSSDAEANRYVRARTYTLRHRGERPLISTRAFSLPLLRGRPQPVASPSLIKAAMPDEINRLVAGGSAVVETPEYLALLAHAHQIPATLQEIGRLREITFRAAGEGSGKALDLDIFDPHYKHLVLWHKQQCCVAGGYRLAWTADTLPLKGVKGLYTSTLFRFHPSFFKHLGPAVELGRSFVRPEFQKDYAPLLVLWQGLARVAASRPEAPVLFGPVSISANYSQAARELIVRFVSQHSFRQDLAPHLTARHPFRQRLIKSSDLQIISNCLSDIESLAAPISDLDDATGVPILLRQYLKLGGRVAGFNVDRDFSSTLDGLLVIDLRDTAPKLLARYMGTDLAEAYRKRVTSLQSA